MRLAERSLPFVSVVVGALPLRLRCAVARTANEQQEGLQGIDGLDDDEGMMFPTEQIPALHGLGDAPAPLGTRQPGVRIKSSLHGRVARFHMGEVSFPIDLVFVTPQGRVGRLVSAAEPGTREQWSYPRTAYVLECRGGLMRAAGVIVGSPVEVIL